MPFFAESICAVDLDVAQGIGADATVGGHPRRVVDEGQRDPPLQANEQPWMMLILRYVIWFAMESACTPLIWCAAVDEI